MDRRPHLEKLFPSLRNSSYRITGPASGRYNCIAHAADSKDAWWQPAPEPTKKTYWPPGVVEEWTLNALAMALGTIGYLPCDNPTLESGFEKIALYADSADEPTHAAKQLPSGAWTSKLGELEEIEHDSLMALEGQDYGRAVRFLKRPRQGG
jgi:hypothetical protein